MTGQRDHDDCSGKGCGFHLCSDCNLLSPEDIAHNRALAEKEGAA